MENDRLLINTGWRFAKTEDINADEALFRPVTLPHDWQIETPQDPDMPGGGSQGFFPRVGVGVYRYTFTAPEDWKNKDARVLFDGIQRFSDIYLNGSRIGGRKYGYIPVMCPLTGLEYGRENTLTVRVDNTVHQEGWTGGGDRWYSGAGIYRNAWFIAEEKAHIAHDGIWVTAEPVFRGPNGDVPDTVGIRCDKANVKVSVETTGDVKGAKLSISISLDGNGVCAFEQDASSKNTFAFELTKPALWTTEKPRMYTLTATLSKPGQADNVHAVRFGVRSAVFDEEEGFILNGVRTKLWGVDFHHDAPVFGAAVPIEVWRRKFEQIKTMGINSVRCSHNPQCEEFYDLCDEMGLLVIDEYCDKWQHSDMYFDLIDDEERLEELEVMIRRDRNHPCVILWSVGNEVTGQYSEYWYQTLEKLTGKVKQLDPTRGVSCALIGFVLDGFNDIAPLGKKLAAVRRYAKYVDVFMGNYMEQFYVKLRESGMRKPIIGSEVFTYYRFDERFSNTADLGRENPYGIVKKYPWVAGAFIWAGADYLGESIGWPCRGWTGCPLDSTGEYKLRAWFCAAQMKTEPVIKIAVFDESEPWDMARGNWGFPQMRSHWKYTQMQKVMNVAVFTNCDTVKLYQNSQTPRTGYLADNPDGMVRFMLPFIPGVLRAEGWSAGRKVIETVVYSDIHGDHTEMDVDRNVLPADGTSVAIADIYLKDNHGDNYVLEDPLAHISLDGDGCVAAIDNGDACTPRDYADNTQLRLFNGHLQVYVRSASKPGKAVLTVAVDGYAPVTAEIEYR